MYHTRWIRDLKKVLTKKSTSIPPVFSSSFCSAHNNKLCVMRPIFCIIDPHDFYQGLSPMKFHDSKFYG
ncbi:CLUMA_CG013614, isoform A [Clunio marinus]|uniref:CLUMA_CG013614, isoform A n=1 Tax=Clunio marinus TaxID=568069 RepID=A0A1J1IJC3_9DIPT|nr:CLUMA_CG013614, isoform A [Clunio marinus]